MADGDEHLGMPVAQDYSNMAGLNPSGQYNDASVQSNALQPDKSAPRTIVSGVERLRAAAHDAEGMLADFEGFVLGMLGEGEAKAQQTPDLPEGAGTVAVVHDAADAVEGMLGRMADLVKRAKAAHG